MNGCKIWDWQERIDESANGSAYLPLSTSKPARQARYLNSKSLLPYKFPLQKSWAH